MGKIDTSKENLRGISRMDLPAGQLRRRIYGLLNGSTTDAVSGTEKKLTGHF